MKGALAQTAVFIAVWLPSALAGATETGGYGVMTYSEARFADAGAVRDEAQPGVLVQRIGYAFNPHLALEGRLGFGLDSYRVKGDEQDHRVALNNLWGGYLVVSAPRWGPVSAYGVVGHTTAATGVRVDEDEAGPEESQCAYGNGLGIGLRYHLASGNALSLEYMDYFDSDRFALSTWSIGLRFRF